ncbi:hypothetical protein CAP31_09360 [Sulfuriferula sp. AH1]|uniref:hypothetical protein n=1 Tax=Sulfuriferula sp. AH1 TaxID=1985873 RepID=UPI000B3B6A9E|nr:hypothetical protein [Sulfuriferula sp. AH1]ARU31861.1 hypothetical protein CAP31_09360 [Sulfuriferula sp. AH1]
MNRICRPRILSVVTLAMLMSACATLPSQPRSANAAWVPSLIVTSQAEELLLYYDYLRKQQPAELAREYDKARQNLAQTRNDVNRVRVALLLSLPNATFHDNAAALALVNEMLKDTHSTNTGLHGLASLLSASLTEQQRTSEDLTQKWKDEQKRADGLQDKVNAIKNMEKNLIRRDQR